MMKLLLAGGGNLGQNVELDKIFVSLLKTKKVLYIPLALDMKRYSFDKFYNLHKDYFLSLGVERLEILNNHESLSSSYLEEFGGIFIGGGNTPQLLYILKKTGNLKLLNKFIEKDKVVYGVSAGAIILAKDILTSLYYDNNDIELTDFESLDKISGFDIWPHFDDSLITSVKEYMSKKSIKKIIAIPDGAGAVINNKKLLAQIKPLTIFEDNQVKKLFLNNPLYLN